MKEVEIKIQITNPEEVIKILQGHGCVFSEPIVQRDVVYIPKNEPTVPVPAGTNVLRIRRQNNKTLLTLKRSDAGNHLSKLEHELEISDEAQMDEIIKLLGFKIIADTTKSRRKCKINQYEICIDHVEELGDFLEIEEMTAGDPGQVQTEMLDFLSKLNIDVSNRMDVGYDVLYVRKHGLK
jgi:adenylate cyclase class 2